MSAAVRLVSSGDHAVTTTVAIVVTVALIALLVEVELVRAYRPRARARLQSLYVAIVPLLLAFVVIVAARLAPLAH